MSENVTIDINAYSQDGAPLFYRVSATVVDKAEAERIVALFPKSAGLRASTISGSSKGTGHILGTATLRSNGVNGGKNETGIKRYRTVVRACKKLGIEVTWGQTNRMLNAYETQADFEAAL